MDDVVIYTKENCPFCTRAKLLLNFKKINFSEISLNKNPEKFDEMIKKSNGAITVPQIFYKNNYIGDCDTIHQLNSEGKLDKLLGI
jgi:glutaredoxin 3